MGITLKSISAPLTLSSVIIPEQKETVTQEVDKTEEKSHPPLNAFNNSLLNVKEPIVSIIEASYVLLRKVINKTKRIIGVIKETKNTILSLK